MLIAHFQSLFAYNSWAWRRVFPSLASLPDAEYKAERPFFWGSLHGLMTHGVTAEWIWLERIQGNNPTKLLDPDDFADFAGIRARWEIERERWGDYLADLTETELQRTVVYRNTRGTTYQMPARAILQHVVNHSTEHRSQMTPVLFQLNAGTKMLDYMAFQLGL